MAKLHEMLQNTLSKRNLLRIYYDDAYHLHFVTNAGETLNAHISQAESVADSIMALDSVQKLTAKAKNNEVISLGEFETCLDQIDRSNHFLGWILKDESATIKSLIRAQPKSPTQSEGRC